GPVVVDRAVVARRGATLDRAAVEGGAAVAVAPDLEVAAAIDDQRRPGLDDRIAARDLDRVVRGAAARAAGLAVERGLVALAGRPCGIDARASLPAARTVAPRAAAAARAVARGAQRQAGRMRRGRLDDAEPQRARPG